MSGTALAYGLSAVAGALAGPVAVRLAGSAMGRAATGGDGVMLKAVKVVESTVMPLRRAASHGTDPTVGERRRLRAAGAIAGACGGWLVGGWWLAVAAGIAAAVLVPRMATWRRARYGRRVEAGAGAAALSIAGALAGGGSIRMAIAAAARELDGPISVELGRAAVELEAGASLESALNGIVGRAPSRSIVTIAAAIRLQRRSGGDLAALLRRIAASLEDERRTTDEAHAATAQARMTSVMVLALPPAGVAMAELASPGLVGRMVGSPVGASLILLATGLQVVGALAVRRLARITP